MTIDSLLTARLRLPACACCRFAACHNAADDQTSRSVSTGQPKSSPSPRRRPSCPPRRTSRPPTHAAPAQRAGDTAFRRPAGAAEGGLSVRRAGRGQAGFRDQPVRAGFRVRGCPRVRTRARRSATRTRRRSSSCPEVAGDAPFAGASFASRGLSFAVRAACDLRAGTDRGVDCPGGARDGSLRRVSHLEPGRRGTRGSRRAAGTGRDRHRRSRRGGAAGAHLVILCTPPAAMPALAAAIAPHLEPGAVVSDVASVKAGVAAESGRIFSARRRRRSRYAGAHPMAGAERSGLAAARADLSTACVCLLTPRRTHRAGRRGDRAAISGRRSARGCAGCHRRRTTRRWRCQPSAARAGRRAGEFRRRATGRAGLRRPRLARHDAARGRFARIMDRNLEPQPRPGYKCARRHDRQAAARCAELLETGREADLEGFLAAKRQRNRRASRR